MLHKEFVLYGHCTDLTGVFDWRQTVVDLRVYGPNGFNVRRDLRMCEQRLVSLNAMHARNYINRCQ